MAKEALVSVIVPIYNEELHIRKCIESIINQDYQNLEIILVNDGSIDNSGRICDEYSTKCKDKTVKVIHKSNGGLISAWKAGVFESTGEYLMFVDSDDYIDSNMIAEMIQHTSDCQREIITSDYLIEKLDGSTAPVYQKLPPGEHLRVEILNDIIPKLLGYEERIVTFSRCMKLISRELILCNMDYCKEAVIMSEDVTIMCPAIMDAERLYVMDHKTYYHYVYYNDSIVHKYDKNAYVNNKIYYDTMKSMLRQKFVSNRAMSEKMSKALDAEEILSLLLIVKNEIRGNKKNCLENLKKLRNDEFVDSILRNTDITLKNKANVLVFKALNTPNVFTVNMLKLAFNIYYRRGNR